MFKSAGCSMFSCMLCSSCTVIRIFLLKLGSCSVGRATDLGGRSVSSARRLMGRCVSNCSDSISSTFAPKTD